MAIGLLSQQPSTADEAMPSSEKYARWPRKKHNLCLNRQACKRPLPARLWCSSTPSTEWQGACNNIGQAEN
eukprot:CAMPEP_0183445740 /NCGR_PEP_ID=MMETSP0370-20130417/96504_1 /TAXON_ID=268820 /ORGANISM="Peridinium aciculiferum, Strain PAER-2" /LENGTH=70 /DNA_ID=CAMNT_0025636367 /DNA_START=80 /DNA_END=290 /DNA_ORIENTATION=-